MNKLPLIHVILFVMFGITGFLLGPHGIVLALAVLAIVELVFWRIDMIELPRSRRTWFFAGSGRDQAPPYDDSAHAILMGAQSRREFDFDLRRRLQRIASSRLAESHGVDLHREPARAAAVLGRELWELIDPQRPVSSERTRGGVSRRQITSIIERLEKL